MRGKEAAAGGVSEEEVRAMDKKNEFYRRSEQFGGVSEEEVRAMEAENKDGRRRDEKRLRYFCVYGVLFALLLVLFIWNINSGSVHMSVREIFSILFLRQGDEMQSNILWQIRLPRIVAAVVLGGALALAGFLLQTFFRNPIAGPFVLGISSGAKMTVALTIVFLLGRGLTASSWVMIAAAFVGSLLSMGFILLVSGKIGRASMLIVCGVMIGYICSAITDFVVTFAEDSAIVNLHNWSMGSFSGIDWGNVGIMTVVVSITSAAVFLCAKPIGAYQLGENYARSVGVNIKMFRIILVLLSSILAACVTAFAGPISFVGIAVPHIARRMLRTSKPLLVIPACFLCGSVFCLFCDLIARSVFAPTEMSISTVTAIFGAPVVILVMVRRRSRDLK